MTAPASPMLASPRFPGPGPPMKIVLALNASKGSLTAMQAASAMEQGIRRHFLRRRFSRSRWPTAALGSPRCSSMPWRGRRGSPRRAWQSVQATLCHVPCLDRRRGDGGGQRRWGLLAPQYRNPALTTTYGTASHRRRPGSWRPSCGCGHRRQCHQRRWGGHGRRSRHAFPRCGRQRRRADRRGLGSDPAHRCQRARSASGHRALRGHL